jgi:uncharacterized protein (TIGR03790 family)
MARALLVLLLLASAGALRAAIDPANTAVVANGNVPEGVALARDFMRHRGIPERHLIVLDLPKDEAIDWHTYAETLLNPLRAKLLAAGLLTGELTEPQDARGRKEYLPTAAPKLSWLVLVHGVPLKLRASGTKPAAAPRSPVRGDQACVDSELALLATVNLDPEGAKPNPWFRTISPAPADAAEVVRIARLDGPTAADVRRALAGAWQAEARRRLVQGRRGAHAPARFPDRRRKHTEAVRAEGARGRTGVLPRLVQPETHRAFRGRRDAARAWGDRATPAQFFGGDAARPRRRLDPVARAARRRAHLGQRP